jgi:hypothetical protein
MTKEGYYLKDSSSEDEAEINKPKTKRRRRDNSCSEEEVLTNLPQQKTKQ